MSASQAGVPTQAARQQIFVMDRGGRARGLPVWTNARATHPLRRDLCARQEIFVMDRGGRARGKPRKHVLALLVVLILLVALVVLVVLVLLVEGRAKLGGMIAVSLNDG